MSRITVTTKLDEEEFKAIVGIAKMKGESVCGLLKRLCRAEITEGSTAETIGSTGLSEISNLYEIEEEKLVKNVKFLLDSGKLHVVDGKMKWNPMAMTGEYFSLDDKIELMGISEIEKNRLKKRIAETLDRISGTDDIGNGAGV